jgi:hypothetical protein
MIRKSAHNENIIVPFEIIGTPLSLAMEASLVKNLQYIQADNGIRTRYLRFPLKPIDSKNEYSKTRISAGKNTRRIRLDTTNAITSQIRASNHVKSLKYLRISTKQHNANKTGT